MIQLLLKVLLFFSFLNIKYAKAQDFYTLSVFGVAERMVNIRATLFPSTDTLLMSPYGATHLKDGWATFVRNLNATSSNGETIELKRLENGVFLIPPENKGKPINITYDVAILHDQEKWPFGYKEAAYVKKDMLMTTGNALFITRMDMDSAEVKFHLNKSYRITNAWRETTPNHFVVKGAEELVWTALAIGNYNLVEVPAGNLKIFLVFGNELSDEKGMIKTTIQKAVNKYKTIYGAYPGKKQSNKTVYIMNIDSSYVGGGATFINSISILLNRKPSITSQANTTSWHHILIHEIGHLWNGISLKTNEKTEWFSEGFTDFIAYKIEREIGLFTEAEWKKLIVQKRNEYQQAKKKSKVTMEDAGIDKGLNYNIIYSGGFLFALKLDTEIKTATKGKKNIEGFLRNIYASFANTGEVITKDNVQKESENTCNCNLDRLFAELSFKN